MKSKKRTLAVVCRNLLVAVALVGVTALVTSQVVSQEEKGPKGAGGPSQEEMMAEYMKANAPGEHHNHLKALTGNWSAASKWRQEPSAPWEESRADAKIETIYDGRFIKMTYRGDMQGQPWEGTWIVGYDNGEQKYNSVWFASTATGLYYSKGACDQSGKVFTLEGDYTDCMTRKPVHSKTVTRVVGNDKFTFEMFSPGPDGQVFKGMEITYTRK